jgi:phage terminase small subunit
MHKSIRTKPLTRKQQLFVEEYCIDKNATQAAKRAGYSANSAYSIGQENLKKPVIRAEIEKSIEQTCDRLQITTERILDEESCIAFFDMRKIVDDNNNLIPLIQLPTHIARAISGLDIKDIYDREGVLIGRTYTYKFYDKGRSLERLAKHKGMYMTRVQVEFEEFQQMILDEIGKCDQDTRRRIVGRLAEMTEQICRN